MQENLQILSKEMAILKPALIHTAPLMILNFILYAILLGLAGWGFNALIDGKLTDGNAATPYLLIFSILSGVIGIASVVAGLQTLSGKVEASAAAAAIGLASWGLTLIAMGLASKQIHIGHIHSKKLKALEAFAIIVSFTQLLYLAVPHASLIMGSTSSANTAPSEPAAPTKTATTV